MAETQTSRPNGRGQADMVISQQEYARAPEVYQRAATRIRVGITQDDGRTEILQMSDGEDRGKPLGKLIQRNRVRRWDRTNYAGVEPAGLAGVIAQLERGEELDEWVDLASYMLRTDPHLRAVYETRVLGGAGAEWRVVPGKGPAGTEEAAEAAAEFVRGALDDLGDVEDTFAQLSHAVGIGWSAAEHELYRYRGGWNSRPTIIPPRDIAFADDWMPRFRAYDDRGAWRWVRADEHRERFIVHTPSAVGEMPNLSGVLLSVAWPWLFKRWAMLWQQSYLEGSGTPKIIGKVVEGAPPEVRDALFEALQNLSGEHIGVLEQGTEVEIVEPNKSATDVFGDALQRLSDEETKGVLGSTLNTDVGSTGGNRSLGESQADVTILPRIQRDMRALAGTIERDWFAPLVRWNAHRWPVTPPLPRLEFVLEQEEPAQIEEWVLTSGVRVRQDEARAAIGLPELGPEMGGDEFIQPPARTVPNLNRMEMADDGGDGRAADPGPFGASRRRPKQLRIPAVSRSTRRRTSPTSPASTSPLASVLSGSSDDPET